MHSSIANRLARSEAKARDCRIDLLPTLFDRAARKYMTAQRFWRDNKIDDTTFTFVEEQFFVVRRVCQQRHILTSVTGV